MRRVGANHPQRVGEESEAGSGSGGTRVRIFGFAVVVCPVKNAADVSNGNVTRVCPSPTSATIRASSTTISSWDITGTRALNESSTARYRAGETA